MKRVLVYLSALPLLALAMPASAITCDEIDLKPVITDQYPNAKDACLDVVERDGKMYMKIKAELARTPRGNHGVFRFMNAADQTFGKTVAIDVPPDFRVNIEGRDYRLRDLSAGQELSVYLPSDRWAVHVHEADAPVETFTPVALVEPREEPRNAEPMLPATASKMPLFALFGALALLGAGMLRVARRQSA